MKLNLDGLGITASIACAIHCAVLPLIFTSLPLMGVDLINDKGFEFSMIGLAFGIGCYALWHGWKRHHHSLLPFSLLFGGFFLLVLKEILRTHLVWMVIPALVLIVSAHYLNYRLCRKANHCHSTDCNH